MRRFKKMGTNFYWKGYEHSDDIKHHLGKRSGAGLYCYDCGTTLNRGGINVIHESESIWNKWLDECLACGKQYDEAKDGEMIGVDYCCSFTWTVMKHLEQIKQFAKDNYEDKIIVNEYGEEFTAKEFLEMLKGCPIWFQSPYEFC